MEELQAILMRCLALRGVTMEDVRTKPRVRSTVEVKQLFVYCAIHRSKRIMKKNKMAAALGVGPWQITYYRKKAEFGIDREPWFKRLVAKYDSMIKTQKQ